MSILDWILVALGVIAVAAFTTYQVLKYKKDRKAKEEASKMIEKELHEMAGTKDEDDE